MLQLWKVINYSSRHLDSVGCKYSLAVQNSGKRSKSEQQKSPEACTLSREHEPARRRWEFLLCLVATGTRTASMSVNKRKITEEGPHMNICIVVCGRRKIFDLFVITDCDISKISSINCCMCWCRPKKAWFCKAWEPFSRNIFLCLWCEVEDLN